jgi:excisionase family DNA binding protein
MRDPVNHQTADTGQVSGEERFLNAREAASLLGVSERTIRRAIVRGRLPATKAAGVFRISPEDVDHYRRSRADTSHRAVPPKPLLYALPPSVPPFRVPIPRFPLIGRERDLQDLEARLARADVALITILGTGGVGKTRLAMEVAARVRDAFPDGIWFVDLAPVHDPAIVPMVIADHLGLQESAGIATLDRLSMFLESRTALLILDNVEHILGAMPSIAALIATAPNLKMLATSRVRLNVVEEHRYPLAPLPLPGHDGTSSHATTGVSPAVELFCRKAQLVRPDFRMTPANAPAVEGICTRLDGLPLAIELAAARVNILHPGDLLMRLDQSLAVLSGGPEDAPRRLRSMRDAIAWSYDLLDPDTRRLFRRLAIFSGGFSEAAAGVVGWESIDDPPLVFTALSALVDNSLLAVEDGVDGTPRFTMLETVREFGVEHLQREGELTVTRDRHAQWCLDLARQAWTHWFTSRQRVWTECLTQDHENLHDALQWMRDSDDRSGLVELAGLLWPYWLARSHWRVGLSWLHKGLD